MPSKGNLIMCLMTSCYHVCMLSHFSHVQLFVIPWTIVHQAPLSMGFSKQEHWSGLPCPPPGDLPGPWIEPMSPASPALQADSLPLRHQGSPSCYYLITIFSQGRDNSFIQQYNRNHSSPVKAEGWKISS